VISIHCRHRNFAPTASWRALAIAWVGIFGQLGPASVGRTQSLDTAPGEALPTQVARPPADVVRRIEQLDQYIERHDWAAVSEAAIRLLHEPVDGWLAEGNGVFVGVRKSVTRRLTLLPPEGLDQYRQRVEQLTSAWLQDGLERRDEGLLRRIVDESFCSEAGDDALWAMGEMALERGDYESARAAWRRVRPETAGNGLAVPRSSIELANVRARLALASIREADFERAERELAELSENHPDAVGRLGGREVNLATELRKLLNDAREGFMPTNGAWPTAQGNSRRNSLSPLPLPRNAQFERAWSTAFAGGVWRCSFPASSGGVVWYQDAEGVHEMALQSQVAPVARLLYAAAAPPFAGALASVLDHGRVFAVVGNAAPRRERPHSAVIALDLARGGALMFRQQSDGERVHFVGPPLVDGSNVIVCEVAAEQGARTAVECYDLWSGSRRWRTSVGWSFDAVAELPASAPVLSSDGASVYVATNSGAIAALRLADGEPLWLRTYRRATAPDGVSPQASPLNPCVIAHSTAFAAPPDGLDLMAIEAATGALLWSTKLPAPGVRAMAVDGDRVLLAGDRMWAVDRRTGRIHQAWGAEATGGAGQGAVAGELIFWPTTHEVLLVDRATGRPTGSALALPEPGGANVLIAAGARLEATFVVAAGSSRLTAFKLLPAPTAASDRLGRKE
jgi:hypothetical protein